MSEKGIDSSSLEVSLEKNNLLFNGDNGNAGLSVGKNLWHLKVKGKGCLKVSEG